jgi:hypothetical protein
MVIDHTKGMTVASELLTSVGPVDLANKNSSGPISCLKLSVQMTDIKYRDFITFMLGIGMKVTNNMDAVVCF